MPFFPRRTRVLLCLALLCAGVPAAAHAAAVQVLVTGTAGPLADAVVTLEPAAGRLSVKPMGGVEIAQAQKQFQPRVTVVTVGTPVSFPNFDTVRHHVYSFSPIKTFELKLYAGVPREPVVFDKPGVAVLGCNIHDQMAAWVVVVDTPLFARSDAKGRATLDAVPAGRYTMHVWHRSLAASTPPVSMPLQVGSADVEQRVQLSGSGAAP
jgi:plastocyanin